MVKSLNNDCYFIHSRILDDQPHGSKKSTSVVQSKMMVEALILYYYKAEQIYDILHFDAFFSLVADILQTIIFDAFCFLVANILVPCRIKRESGKPY